MSVTAPGGFLASGLAVGIKETGAFDLSIVAAQDGAVPAGAVFTSNRAAAAPVQVSKRHLATNAGRVRAVVLNSGCANAATGKAGIEAATSTCSVAAELLGASLEEVLVCSTGLIGIPLQVEKILTGLPELVKTAGASRADGTRAATGILTTDTHPKEVVIDGDGFCVGGMAKGAGMIAPNLATMLVVLTTDALLEPADCDRLLRSCVATTFNDLIVDGCTSTNDTVILLSSGRAGSVPDNEVEAALHEACDELCLALAEDAEGTTRVAEIEVRGAESDDDARRAGRQVALSLLVKTSLFGGDPYWGRVVSELGASGAAFDLDRVEISYGGIVVCRDGVEIDHDREAVASHMAGKRLRVGADLHLGSGASRIVTTDLGHGYIDENMRTS